MDAIEQKTMIFRIFVFVCTFVHANLKLSRKGLTNLNAIFANALRFCSTENLCLFHFKWYINKKAITDLTEPDPWAKVSL